jgi:hypothetical protein
MEVDFQRTRRELRVRTECIICCGGETLEDRDSEIFCVTERDGQTGRSMGSAQVFLSQLCSGPPGSSSIFGVFSRPEIFDGFYVDIAQVQHPTGRY